MKKVLSISTWARSFGFALMLVVIGGGTAWSQGIIHVIPQQPIYYSAGFLDLENAIDINDDGIPDFGIISTSSYDADITPLNSNSIIAWPEPSPDLGCFVWALNEGDMISSSLDSSLQWYDNQTDQFGRAAIGAQALVDNQLTVLGFFAQKASAYAGFDLLVNGTNYYGWIQISNPDNIVYGQVVDWAFETSPNTPIKAGQISEPISFSANLCGANEVPPNRSGNSGTGTFMLESFIEGFVLTYHIELDGAFVPTSAGIFGPANPNTISLHKIANLGNAQIVFQPPLPPIGPVPCTPATTELNRPTPFLPPPSLIVYDGQITLSSNQVTQLLRGQFYVNLKSPRFPRGELRGEILSTAPIRFSATLSGRNGFSRNARTHRGEATFVLTGSSLSYEVAMDVNFAWTGIGIYSSPFATPFNLVAKLDTTFGVMIPVGGLPNAPGFPGQVLYSGQLTLTDQQVSQLKNGQLYLQVRTSRFRNGEFGGRILPAE